jgi:asparagine synthase (glutamine-hydrolysing)
MRGPSAINMLAGMFAFAVWDRDQKSLLLVREAVGARTLYYTTSGNTRFASVQLAPLARLASQEIDFIALRDYLSCAFVPGDKTMFKHVSEVRPGTTVRLPDGATNTYWQVEERIEGADQPIEWHAERLRALLDQIMKEYLPEGAPVGAYLSGGLDSSLVVALAAKFHSRSVHTYSIHFGSECPSELEFSSLVASHCNTNHHIIEITPVDMWGLLPESMACLDDPIGDPLTVPNLILGRKAKEDVDVILNGEGGDPCFGGPKNQPMLLSNIYSAITQSMDESQIAMPAQDAAYLASFQKCSMDLPRLLNREVWEEVKSAESPFHADLNSDVNYLNRLLFINIKYKGADHILTKVNNITSAVDLTGLSPLFDHRLVEMSLTIPPEFKLSGAQEKAVLKEAVKDVLPAKIIERPKSGMMVPVQLGFRKYWPRQARSLLLSRNAKIKRYLDQSVIREWLDYRGDTWSRYGVKLWLLVSLELWLQSHTRD